MSGVLCSIKSHSMNIESKIQRKFILLSTRKRNFRNKLLVTLMKMDNNNTLRTKQILKNHCCPTQRGQEEKVSTSTLEIIVLKHFSNIKSIPCFWSMKDQKQKISMIWRKESIQPLTSLTEKLKYLTTPTRKYKKMLKCKQEYKLVMLTTRSSRTIWLKNSLIQLLILLK